MSEAKRLEFKQGWRKWVNWHHEDEVTKPGERLGFLAAAEANEAGLTGDRPVTEDWKDFVPF